MTDEHKTNLDLIAELTGLRAELVKLRAEVRSGAELQRRLRETEESEVIILSSISDAVMVTDDDGLFKYVSPSVKEVFGYTPEEVMAFGHVGKLLGYDFFSRKLLKERGRIRNIQRRTRDKDGILHVMLVHVEMAAVKGGSTLLVCQDITERARAEEALLASEDRYRSLFENMGNGVAIYGAQFHGGDFVCVDLNHAAEAITGLDRHKIVSRRIGDVLPSFRETGLLDVYRRVWRTGKPEHHPVTKYPGATGEKWTENFVYKLPSGEIVDVFNDRTESIRAHQELAESERRFRALYENEHVVMLLIDPSSLRIVDGNPAACSFYGFPREELTAMTISQLNTLPEDDIRRAIEQASSGCRRYFDFKHRLATGEIRDVTVCSCPITVAGSPLMYSIVVDVSETKQAVERLRKSEKRLATALSGGDLGLWDFNVGSGGLVFTRMGTGELEAVAGEADSPARARQSVVHQDDLPMVREALARHVSGQCDRFEAEHRIQAENGSWIWVLARGMVSERDERGNPVRVSGTHLDITRRKEVELALERSKHQFRALFSEWMDVILIIDVMNGKIVSANKTAQKVLMYQPEVLVGLHISRLFACDDVAGREELLDRLRVSGGVFEARRLIRSDGSEVPMDLMATVVLWEDNTALLAVLRDVTERELREKNNQRKFGLIESVFDNMPMGILAVGHDHKILLVNGYARSSLGLDASDIGRDLFELIPDLKACIMNPEICAGSATVKGPCAGKATVTVLSADVLPDGRRVLFFR